MLYVIPFIILLVVAVILKKRENSQKQEATSPKNINRKSGKKASAKSSKSSREKTKAKVIEENTPAIPQSNPVPEALRHNIQQLIQEKQFSAAEAQVNQALKKIILNMNCIYYFLKFILLRKMNLQFNS